LTIEVAQGEPVELVLDLGAHAENGVLHDVVEEIALEESQQGGRSVESQHDEEHPAQGDEVDALTRYQIDSTHHVGDLVPALGPDRFDRLVLGEPGREELADDPGEDQVGGPPEHLGTGRAEGDADHTGHDHGDDPGTLGPEPLDEAFDRGSEVERFLAHHPAAERATPAGSALALDPLGLFHGTGGGHDASAASWDSTISA